MHELQKQMASRQGRNSMIAYYLVKEEVHVHGSMPAILAYCFYCSRTIFATDLRGKFGFVGEDSDVAVVCRYVSLSSLSR